MFGVLKEKFMIMIKTMLLKSSVELVVLNVKMHIHLNIFKVLSHHFIFEVSKVYNVMAKYD